MDLRTTWNLDDVMDALESLAVQYEDQRRAYEVAERKAKEKK